MVVPHGNAPRSLAYQARALLLSYRTTVERRLAEGVGSAPTSVLSGSCCRDRCSQLISACLPLTGVRCEVSGGSASKIAFSNSPHNLANGRNRQEPSHRDST